eukprot:CAMPEP_0205828258 /NCGR_PEP_ID=MMETSP0206-20130828/34572_1 /ASSEMBLY_ACC=CAM_ASM_000279 /TAXON_ID=36767 /ORGANISM="Euplotes focardii, Strain TN1" /LENGTH=92 /DNA_ID=CAMNT_0053129903 /DNA_START=168 /DNA_END=446 /DNA_ORIENTATION=+
MIGGHSQKTGFSSIKGQWPHEELDRYYRQTQFNLMFPGLKDYDEHTEQLEKYEYRRLRADIREMKLGNKEIGDDGSSMSVFELKSNKSGIGR